MGNTVSDINKITQLQFLFGQLWDENFKLRDKTVYNSKIKNFNEELKKIGVDSSLPPKEIELKLQQIYELLTKAPKFKDADKTNDIKEAPRPKGENATTLTSDQFENLENDLDRVRKSEEIREKQKAEVESVLKTKQRIKEEQDRLQRSKPSTQTISIDEIEVEQQSLKEEIKKAENVQEVLKDKKIYANVVIPEIPVLTPEEQKDFEELEAFAKDPKTRTKLINDLEREIETRIKPTLREASDEDIKIIARSTAVDLVEKLASQEARQETRDENIQTAVYQSLATHHKVIKNVVSRPEQIQELEKGSLVLALHKKESNSTSQTIAGVLIGPKFTRILYGPDYREIKVVISESPLKDQTHTVDLGSVNREFINLQQKQNILLEHAKTFGIQETRGYISNRTGIYISRAIEKLPAGSIVKKTYSSPILQSFLSKYGLTKPIVWEAVGQSRVVGLLIKVAPESAGPTLAVAGKVLGKELVKPVAGAVAGKIATQVAGKATGASLGATIGAITGLSGGPLAIVTAAVGYVAGEVLGKFFSKLKVWWTKNKDSLAPVLAIGGAITIGRFFGPGAGILGGIGTFALFGGSVAGLALGAWRFFGILGRNIGITIATPVIVTLLVLPPLVAFIMLVINNSAYVVPPGLKESSTGGGIISPYIGISKTATPAGPFTNADLAINVNYTITVTAKKGPLTNIKISDQCKVISKKNIECPEIISDNFPTSINPGSPYTFSYSMNFDQSYEDSVVINTVTVSADTDDKKGAVAETSTSITIGNPPISCPLPNGHPDNQMNYSYNSSNDTGHGSTAYWGTGNKYYFPMPQSTSCFRPSDCPYYGYAYDVFPSGTNDIFAPSVLGEDVTWNCSYAFSNGGGSAGHTYKCKSIDGNYLLVLTHMQNGAKTGEIKSGEKIGVLYNQGGNTHLHIEFQLGGQWQKPENYFCK